METSCSVFKNLAWIKDALGIQNALEIPQNPNINFTDRAGKKCLFRKADTVFSADRAPKA